MTTSEHSEHSKPLAVPLSDQLGLVERLRFLASGQDDPHSAALTEAADKLARCGGDNCMGRRCNDVTNWVTEQAAEARVAAERERWRVALGACDAALAQCQPCADHECGAQQREYIETARAAAAQLLRA